MNPYETNNYGDVSETYESNQRPPPSKYQVRPRVDPEAEGEVDPSLWVFIWVHDIKNDDFIVILLK